MTSVKTCAYYECFSVHDPSKSARMNYVKFGGLESTLGNFRVPNYPNHPFVAQAASRESCMKIKSQIDPLSSVYTEELR